MFEGAFSFRGRIGRLSFFLNGVVMTIAMAVAITVLALMIIPARHDGLGIAFFGLCVALLLIAMLWYSLSLHVRRINDIGWDPVVVIVGWIALNLLDFVLAGFVPSLAFGPHVHGTGLAGLINFVLGLILLFWPGRHGDGVHLDNVRLDGAAPELSTRSVRTGFGRRDF